MNARLAACALGLLLALWAGRSYATAAPSFEYDVYAPLELVTEDSRTADGGVRVSDIAFRSGNAVVRAALVQPRDPLDSMPGVLFAHWLGDPATTNRTEFLADAEWLARRGIVSLLPDEPWSQPQWFARVRSTASDAADSVAVVIALRRALDVLTRTNGVDRKRLAFVGHDFGAMYGALLAGADTRVRDVVFVAPTVTFAEWFLLDTGRPPADRAAYEAQMAAFDIPAALARATFSASLLQFGARDRYVPSAKAHAFAAAVSQPDKTVRTYPADHALTLDAATDERRSWLLAHLTAP